MAVLLFYSKQILPETFRAVLNGFDISSAFVPGPGKYETVVLPLMPGSNVLKLSVDGVLESGRVATDSDRLVFDVR